MATTHHYRAGCRWEGSTGSGYRDYDRSNSGRCPPADHELPLSAGAAFRGDESRINPEQLLVLAASSCQLLSFLALAARNGLDVLAYADDATAAMPVQAGPMSLASIELRPVVTVAPGTDPDRVLALVDRAHHECYVANTLACPVIVEATVVVVVG